MAATTAALPAAAPTTATAARAPLRPRLSFAQILSMNFGFFGIQYSFGLQQANMSPIYRYLGADEANLPYLWLAGPMTGLLIQPLIGAMSDRTLSPRGRRTPYFLVGAVLCSLALLAMPFSPALWAAAGLLWILDAGNNVTMEPYRAFVSDRLDPSQHSIGFLTQSAFTGLGQTLSYLTPSLLVLLGMSRDATNGRNIPYVTVIAFLVGAVFSIASILWTVRTTPELPLTDAERAHILAQPRGAGATLREVGAAMRDMPATMKQLAVVYLFQWYGLFAYWQYINDSIGVTLFGTRDAHSPAYHEAVLVTGQAGAFYNFVAFTAAFAMVPFTRRFGPKVAHVICLALAGAAMLSIPSVHDRALLLLPMVGIGLAWASIMGNPYVMLAGSIPRERVGVYMGIFNMFIVIPMIVQIATFKPVFRGALGGNPENAVRLAGAMLLCAAAATVFVRAGRRERIGAVGEL